MIGKPGILRLRDEFRSLRAANDNKSVLAPIQTIMMVGGIPCPVRGVSDTHHLSATFCALSALNIPVSAEFDVDVVNIEKRYGRRDFLKETSQADLVILCFLFNPFYEDSPQDNGRFSISEKHFERGAWHDAALRVGARVISVIGGGSTEVGPDPFISHVPNSKFMEMRGLPGVFGCDGPRILVRKPEGP